jgi:hypothetical protein
MPKKLLFVTVLLLLVSVQALAASCDLRCSLMGTSAQGHAWHADEPMSHCFGMSMERSQGDKLTASDSCAGTTCGTELKAINKGAGQHDAESSKLLVSAVALLVDPPGNSALSRTTVFASFSRSSDSRPLAQRPGSSLRI